MAQSGGLWKDMRNREDDNISYLREMLGQLRNVADSEGCDMLCYLLEMAYLEASEIEIGRRPRSQNAADHHH